jgi:nitrite reductase/ring-hydroxylating ferredoxin subunit
VVILTPLLAALLLTGAGRAAADVSPGWTAWPGASGAPLTGYIDTPVANAALSGGQFLVSGWVVDPTATTSAGVDDVRVFVGPLDTGTILAIATTTQNSLSRLWSRGPSWSAGSTPRADDAAGASRRRAPRGCRPGSLLLYRTTLAFDAPRRFSPTHSPGRPFLGARKSRPMLAGRVTETVGGLDDTPPGAEHLSEPQEAPSMSSIVAERVRVGSVTELEQRGCVVISAGGHGIAVFAHDGRFFAVDNRCPHMGFPLSRGTVRDGLLTCHWHHARFDLEGGGTLDPFADNVRSFPVERDGDSVFVVLDDTPLDERGARWLARLEEGLEHQLEFVLAKASIALLGSGTPPAAILRAVGRYGLRYRGGGWGMGMTILTAVGWLLPRLAAEDRPLALFHGAVRVGEDTAGGAPRFALEPLPAPGVPQHRR